MDKQQSRKELYNLMAKAGKLGTPESKKLIVGIKSKISWLDKSTTSDNTGILFLNEANQKYKQLTEKES